jgi:hypothetical protein
MFAFVSAVAPVGVSAFAGRGVSVRPATASVSANTTRAQLENVQPVFTKAMEDYKEEYAPFAKRGWGATTKAEVCARNTAVM